MNQIKNHLVDQKYKKVFEFEKELTQLIIENLSLDIPTENFQNRTILERWFSGPILFHGGTALMSSF